MLQSSPFEQVPQCRIPLQPFRVSPQSAPTSAHVFDLQPATPVSVVKSGAIPSDKPPSLPPGLSNTSRMISGLPLQAANPESASATEAQRIAVTKGRSPVREAMLPHEQGTRPAPK